SRLRQAVRGDDPDVAAVTGATRPAAARRERTGAGAVGERGDYRPSARRCEGRGSGRAAPSCRVLLGDPARGSDPHFQRLEEPAARLLRDRPGGTRRHGRFDGAETARIMARLYAAARLYVNFFQPSFKLKEKRREGAKVIKRYHDPATPFERALAHPKPTAAVKERLREHARSGRTLGRDPHGPGGTRQSRRSSCRQ